jgi:hypothetical protein
MDNVQKVDNYVNIPSSQTSRSYKGQCPVYGKGKIVLCMLMMYGGEEVQINTFLMSVHLVSCSRVRLTWSSCCWRRIRNTAESWATWAVRHPVPGLCPPCHYRYTQLTNIATVIIQQYYASFTNGKINLIWRVLSFVIQCHVIDWKLTDIFEEHVTSIFRVNE